MLSKRKADWLDWYWKDLMIDVSDHLLNYWDAIFMYNKQKTYLEEN